MLEFNFLTSFIIFTALLTPIFTILFVKSKDSLIQKGIFHHHGKYIYILVGSISLLIFSSAISISQNSLHILNIFMIAFTLCILLFIMLTTSLTSTKKLKIYMITIISIVLVYTTTVSLVNDLYPYYNDDIRDILASYKIIDTGSITDSVNLLQTTERYYSALPIFPLLITVLTYIVGNVKITYLFFGIIQVLGIVFGTFILSMVINKYMLHKINHDNIKKQLSYLTSVIGSLLIIGLPYGFFTIIATQPQSISIILTLLAISILIKFIVKELNRVIVIILAALAFAANIYHPVIVILLLILGLYYLLIYIYKNSQQLITRISLRTVISIMVLTSSLIIIYWYDVNVTSSLAGKYEQIINTLRQTNVEVLTISHERFSEGFKFYAYSYSFFIAIILSLLLVFILNKINILYNIDRNFLFMPNIAFALILLLIVTLAFISTVIQLTGGLGRYLLGQGIIFISFIVIINRILAIFIINNINKRVVLVVIAMIFIYHLSGLTQPYWNPDNTFKAYSTVANYKNVASLYSKMSKTDILYLEHNIPVTYDLPYTDDYLIKLYKLRSDYTYRSRDIINGEPLFYNITSPSQSVINFLSTERISDTLKNNNKFNIIFMSNRYSAFYTSPFMTQR